MKNSTKNSKGKNKNYSISKKLRTQGKSSEEFEIIFNNLSLEEVIGLKLELTSHNSFNSKLYGVPIWYRLSNIIKDAVLKYALSATRSKREAARFLGLNESSMKKNINKYKIDEYFQYNTEQVE
jgi:uncharacterized membrane-anchored protein|tara:strand:+ start:3448 stop:3819 length:372 start_codon:yes stop_codon:yes gene_type:complete